MYLKRLKRAHKSVHDVYIVSYMTRCIMTTMQLQDPFVSGVKIMQKALPCKDLDVRQGKINLTHSSNIFLRCRTIVTTTINVSYISNLLGRSLAEMKRQGFHTSSSLELFVFFIQFCLNRKVIFLNFSLSEKVTFSFFTNQSLTSTTPKLNLSFQTKPNLLLKIYK